MKRYLWLLLFGLVGCSDDAAGPDDPVDESELEFVRLESASAVTVRQASVWAVRGSSRTLTMRYADGTEFVRFAVGSNALLRRPDGTLFQNGDSILITAQLDNSNRILLHFEPSGLVFNPLAPARLEISYARGDRDIDNDGDEDDTDRLLELRLRIWQQERAGLPWLPLVSLRLDDDEIEARVLSFTGFAMASE